MASERGEKREAESASPPRGSCCASGAGAPGSILAQPTPVLIPSELHSAYKDGPFDACSVCDHPLALKGCPYEIQKVFRGREVLFEMAICQPCGEQLCREFSQESMEALKGFLFSNFRPSPEALHCHFCGLPRALLGGWTLVGACQGSSLILPAIVLCDRCGESLQRRLSRHTRETQEDFIRQNFPCLPADVDFSPTICVR